jgi:hypothetical protein
MPDLQAVWSREETRSIETEDDGTREVALDLREAELVAGAREEVDSVVKLGTTGTVAAARKRI